MSGKKHKATIDSVNNWRPDWKESGNYPDPQNTSNVQWAWEFLRRNNEYQEHFLWAQENLKSDDRSDFVFDVNLFDPSPNYEVTRKAQGYFNKYQINAFIDPSLDYTPVLNDFFEIKNMVIQHNPEFSVERFFDDESEKIVSIYRGPHPESPAVGEVFLRLDMTKSLSSQWETKYEELRRIQASLGLKQKHLKPHYLGDELVVFLRILDASIKGVKLKEIAKRLDVAGTVPDPDFKTFSKKLEKANKLSKSSYKKYLVI